MANQIHETVVIGPDVEIGDGNVILPYTVILGPTTIGDRNWIGPHVSIGTPGEWSSMSGADMATHGAWTGVHIGDENVIREYTTVQQGDGRATSVASRCYLMARTHVPHDCLLADRVVLSTASQVGGCSIVGEGANIGLGAVLHQFSVVGAWAMIGMQSAVTKPVPPGALVMGVPARVQRANTVGMERAGLDADDIAAVERTLRGEAPGPVSPRLEAALATYAADLERVG